MERCVGVIEEVNPDPERHTLYEELFGVYKAIYDSTAAISTKLDKLLGRLPKSNRANDFSLKFICFVQKHSIGFKAPKPY